MGPSILSDNDADGEEGDDELSSFSLGKDLGRKTLGGGMGDDGFFSSGSRPSGRAGGAPLARSPRLRSEEMQEELSALEAREQKEKESFEQEKELFERLQSQSVQQQEKQKSFLKVFGEFFPTVTPSLGNFEEEIVECARKIRESDEKAVAAEQKLEATKEEIVKKQKALAEQKKEEELKRQADVETTVMATPSNQALRFEESHVYWEGLSSEEKREILSTRDLLWGDIERDSDGNLDISWDAFVERFGTEEKHYLLNGDQIVQMQKTKDKKGILLVFAIAAHRAGRMGELIMRN